MYVEYFDEFCIFTGGGGVFMIIHKIIIYQKTNFYFVLIFCLSAV